MINSKYMKKRIITNITLFLAAVVLTTGVGSYIYYRNRPVNVYERGLKKTLEATRTSVQNTINTSGDINELNSQTFFCSTDKEKNILEVTKIDKDIQSQVLVVGNELYLKDNSKYVNIADSDYLKKFTNNMKLEGNKIYDDFQEKIRESISKKNLEMKKEKVTIGNKDYVLRMIDLVVPKEKAEEIISAYVKDDFESNADTLIDETISTQQTLSNATFSEKEKQSLKDKMKEQLLGNLQEKLDNMKYSDITIRVGIDDDGYIRYREENYTMTLEGKNSTIQNITQYLAFGKDVQITNPDTIEKEDLETYLENQKEKQKNNIKNNALEHPNGEIDITKAKDTTEKVVVVGKDNKENTDKDSTVESVKNASGEAEQ